MTDTWVVNASPLILLAKAGHLDLLEQSASNVLVPNAVKTEVLAGPPGDPARDALLRSWGRSVSVATVPSEVLEWGRGAGENEVIAAALAIPC